MVTTPHNYRDSCNRVANEEKTLYQVKSDLLDLERAKLKRNSFDMKKLKVMTGEWFAEVKAKRYGDLSSGIDILKNSFNRKKKIPVVQDVPVKASEDVNVFLSPNFQHQNVCSDPEALKSGE
eukprot:g48108.t1